MLRLTRTQRWRLTAMPQMPGARARTRGTTVIPRAAAVTARLTVVMMTVMMMLMVAMVMAVAGLAKEQGVVPVEAMLQQPLHAS